MTRWRVTNATSQKPYKYYQPDLYHGKSSFRPVGKGGILGTLQQPAEYTGRYAWKHYGGTEKTRALALKAQHDIPPWVINRILKFGSNWYQYGIPKRQTKKYATKSSYQKLQKSSKLRTRKQTFSNQYCKYPFKWCRQPRYRTNKSYRQSGSSWRPNKIFRNPMGYGQRIGW